jgi:PAS domain S-box-containing protein
MSWNGAMSQNHAEANFRGLLEAAPDAMVIVNHDGVIKLINSQTEKMFGYTRAELLGEPVELLVPLPSRNGHARHRKTYVSEPHPRPMGTGLELSGRRKDGSEFPVEISLSPFETAEGVLITAAVRDITERKRLEEIRREIRDRQREEAQMRRMNETLEERVQERTRQLEQANQELKRNRQELQAANEELESFTYSVSHDLRAPIRQIDGFARLLAENLGDALDPAARQYLRRVQEGAVHMGRLVDDLLQLARVGRQESNPARLSLGKLVRDVIADLQPQMQDRQVEWRISPLPEAEGDPGLLKIVFTNLLGNALKYTRPRERAVIEIAPWRQQEEQGVFVRDNGVGFDMQYADKLFGVFQRLHRVEEFEGTGVGLATVQRIIHKHGGRIWAEAKLDEGATFYFSLGNGAQSGGLK